MTGDRAERPSRPRALLTTVLAAAALLAVQVAATSSPARADGTTTTTLSNSCILLHIGCPTTTTTGTTLPPVPTTSVAPDCIGVPSVVDPDGNALHCTFSDDFTDATLDPARWIPTATTYGDGQDASNTVQTGTTHGDACIVNSSANEHLDGGFLYLTAQAESAPVTCKAGSKTISKPRSSGEVSTNRRFDQTFGEVEIRAKLPAQRVGGVAAPGLQTSFWMWPTDSTTYPESEEIDIAEMYSQFPDLVVPYIHYNHAAQNGNDVTNQDFPGGDLTGWHTYKLTWTPTHIQMYIDDQPILNPGPGTRGHTIQSNALIGRQAPAPFDHDFYLILSQGLGIGGDAYQTGKAAFLGKPAVPATPLPATTQIDWVRVYG